MFFIDNIPAYNDPEKSEEPLVTLNEISLTHISEAEKLTSRLVFGTGLLLNCTSTCNPLVGMLNSISV
jgi:hypothetical protein